MDSLGSLDSTSQIPIKLPSSIFLPYRSYFGWKIVVTLFHLMSSSSTIYRLAHRYRIRRLWWDDYILLGALILDTAYWPLYWARFPKTADHPSELFQKTQRILNAYWFTMFPFILLMGSTRAAMALSIARNFPPRHAARRWAFTLVIFMVFAGLASLLVTTLTCKAVSPLLVASEMENCIIAYRNVPLKHILFFIVDFLSDSLLIITPLVIFWRVKLPPAQRRLILINFCGNVLTLLGAIAYFVIANSQTVFSLEEDRPLVNLGLGAIEVSMGFMACDMVVLSTCFYQAYRKFRSRPRTPVVPAQNPNPVAPAPEPPVYECSCMTSDHITPLSLTEISTFHTQPSNLTCTGDDTDLHDMLDSYHPSDSQDSIAGSDPRKTSSSAWSYPTAGSSKSQKSTMGSTISDEPNSTFSESPSFLSDSVKQETSSSGSSESETSDIVSSIEQTTSPTSSRAQSSSQTCSRDGPSLRSSIELSNNGSQSQLSSTVS